MEHKNLENPQIKKTPLENEFVKVVHNANIDIPDTKIELGNDGKNIDPAHDPDKPQKLGD